MTSPNQNPYIALLQGQQFDQFQLRDFRASGQFSLVFEAQDTTNSNDVALKVLTPVQDAGALFEFQREGELLQSLDKSSNVVDLLKTNVVAIDVQTQQGLTVPLSFHYHALELATGVLEEIVLARHKVNLRERVQLWRCVVRGVHQMHRRQIVHRDIKSSNCLVFPDNDVKERVKVADLGRGADTKLPHHFGPQDYLTGRGDYRFAPPECLFMQAGSDRKACKNIDVYGLGSLLFELVTGQGITSLALGYGPDIVRQALNQAASGRTIDLSSLRDKYADAFVLFDEELPRVIRHSAGSLLRQLCDPVPDARLPKVRFGPRSVTDGDLEWLLKRADILIKGLHAPRRTTLKARQSVS